MIVLRKQTTNTYNNISNDNDNSNTNCNNNNNNKKNTLPQVSHRMWRSPMSGIIDHWQSGSMCCVPQDTTYMLQQATL